MTAAHEQWIADRDAEVWAPYGIASLAATHWLDETERSCEGVPGRWRTDRSDIVGSDTPDGVRLRPGEQIFFGDRMLRGMTREDSIALRVWAPDAAARRGISVIDRAPFDPELVRIGAFTERRVEAPTLAVDGHRAAAAYIGTVGFDLAGATIELTVSGNDDGTLSAAFSDATSGVSSYRFRFLRLPHPGADGRVEVDLNRAYLPPCAFSDHYVCAFPQPGNRLRVPVVAGELRVR